MSGNSSGGAGSGFGGVADVACSALHLEAQIATPNAAGIATVAVGKVLAVTLHLSGGQQVVALFNGSILVGGLSGGPVNRLRDCLAAGTRYTATVKAISGALVMVRIDPIP